MAELDLMQRLERLERQNRRLRQGLLIGALVGAALSNMAQIAPFPPELRAQRIALVDESGDTRIELRADGPAPSVVLRDGDDVLVHLTTNGQRGVIRYVDEQGRTRDLASPMGVRPLTQKPR